MRVAKGQLTLRGVAIGCIGCIIITASSAYTALKMGALPWPIVFAAIASLFFLKAAGRGKASLNEANVTHTIMSAGAMVAGGLAFTVPGAWMLGLADEIAWPDMLLVALSGVMLGLICTAALRRRFIEDAGLEYPIGEAAAQTLIAGNAGGGMGAKLFASMGLAGAYTALRDGLGALPAVFFGNVTVPGVAFGLYNSPLLMSVGFLVGTGAVIAWFAAAVLAHLGLTAGGAALGLWDAAGGQGIVSSLGMGAMMGAGLGVVVRTALSKARQLLRSAPPERSGGRARSQLRLTPGLAAGGSAAIALLICFGVQLGAIPSLIVVLLTWVATIMSAQSVGRTGIDPMEIFGLIALLAVAACSETPQAQLFFVAGIVAVACGLAGDVMNDFHAGHVLGTDPRAQWIGQAIGALLGAFVSAGVMVALVTAYGPESFGPGGTFVAAQASVVAAAVAGLPSVPAFALGLAAGLLLQCANLPAMMIALGIYLPFHMSAAAFVGALCRLAGARIARLRRRGLNGLEAETRQKKQWEGALVVASGIIGGESIAGVIAALAAVAAGLGA